MLYVVCTTHCKISIIYYITAKGLPHMENIGQAAM